jgi:DNA modification methylase
MTSKKKSKAQHVQGVLMKSDSGNDPQYYYKKQQKEKELGRKLTTEEFQEKHYEGPDTYESGTSIFDPVLCELVYRWFCPMGGTVLDPFAGGSVRGIVASKLRRQYVGVELRPEQVAANQQQARKMKLKPAPIWHTGDSLNIRKISAGVSADLVFSCPPYADLEVYSDHPQDLSTMSYEQFLVCYRRIIAESMGMLKPDRFACFVVGDVREKGAAGYYRNFVSDTIDAFQRAGARLYNEAVLVTSVGSLPIRVGKQFAASRKLGKTHQNVLVFCKGDPKKATLVCGQVEVSDVEGSS